MIGTVAGQVEHLDLGCTLGHPRFIRLSAQITTGLSIDDADRLNAPWGVALAPANFGPLSNALLVGNFGGAGKIAAFNSVTGRFIDFLRDESGNVHGIDGLWALQFGNGASLGDSNALYFSAGPLNETAGLFGSLRHAG